MSRSDSLVQLSEHLSDRIRFVSTGELPIAGRHVIYGMYHAVRGHENPALDVRAELAEASIDDVFWPGNEPKQPALLLQLAADAALVVTEDFPARPFPHWTTRLADGVETPVWVVDTACVVPKRLVGGSHDRAYAFRTAARDELEARLHLPWPAADAETPRFDRSDLEFEDTDLEHAKIADLGAPRTIDHALGPVPHTPGGSLAGYARWNPFRRRGRYARTLRGATMRRSRPPADSSGCGLVRLRPRSSSK